MLIVGSSYYKQSHIARIATIEIAPKYGWIAMFSLTHKMNAQIKSQKEVIYTKI